MSTPAPPVPSGPSPATHPPTAASGGKVLGLSKGVWVAIVAVVVVAAVVGGLFVAGVIPGLKGSTPGGPSGPTYNITFTESGLTGGTSWSVTLGGATQSSATTSIVFGVRNGTYSFTVGSVSGFVSTPASGSITVSGTEEAQTVTFAALPPGKYVVTFTESGLPTGTAWSVTLGGLAGDGTGTSIVFPESNGSYPFTSGSVAGFTPSPASGNVKVSGGAAAQGITYTASSGGPGQTSYGQAEPVAAAEAAKQGSGWVAIYADGSSLTSAYTNSTPPEINASCPLTGGLTSWPTLPAWTGNYSNGYASFWVFIYYESSGPGVMYILTEGSTATLIGTITGASCVPTNYASFVGLGAGVLDSPSIATSLLSDPTVAGYVTAHPSASSGFGVFSGLAYHGESTGPAWYILFTTCTPGGGGTGENLTAVANGTTGAVTYAATASGSCGPTALGHVEAGGGTVSDRSLVPLEMRRP